MKEYPGKSRFAVPTLQETTLRIRAGACRLEPPRVFVRAKSNRLHFGGSGGRAKEKGAKLRALLALGFMQPDYFSASFS
jgi:hypothetical protein